jgi:hypothetical protein
LAYQFPVQNHANVLVRDPKHRPDLSLIHLALQLDNLGDVIWRDAGSLGVPQNEPKLVPAYGRAATAEKWIKRLRIEKSVDFRSSGL